MSDIKRVRFFDGEFLVADDFSTDQDYHRQMRYRHNKDFHTWGIVNGLDVIFSPNDKFVTISPGMAVDKKGQEMVLLGSGTVDFDTEDYVGNSSYYITINWNEAEVEQDENGNAKRYDETPVIAASTSAPVDPDIFLILALVTLNVDKTINSIDSSGRTVSAIDIGNDSVTSAKIAEADGTSSQLTDSGSGVKTGHIQDEAVTEAKLAAALAAKLVTNGDTHRHSSGDGAQISHGSLNMDDGSNPHGVAMSQLTDLNANNGNITNLATPTTITHAANKSYVDGKTGGTISSTSNLTSVTPSHTRQVNASLSSTAGGLRSQVNAGNASNATGSYSQINASYSSDASNLYSQVNASYNCNASGAESQVNAGYNSTASASFSQVNTSYNSFASNNYSQVNTSLSSTANGDRAQINSSKDSTATHECSQVNASDGATAGGEESQINASNSSTTNGLFSQINASDASGTGPSGSFSQVNASFNGTALSSYSQVNASTDSSASGEKSQINASDNCTATGDKSQVNASEQSSAAGERSQVNASYRCEINHLYAQIHTSRGVASPTNYSVCGGYSGAGSPTASTSNRKWQISSMYGHMWISGTLSQSYNFTDYGEYFENLKKGEIEPGVLIALEGAKVRPAKKDEDFIGVVSATAGIRLGDTPFCWKGRYLVDEWGRQVFEEIKDPDWKPKKAPDKKWKPKKGQTEADRPMIEVETEKDRPTIRVQKENPDYDPEKEQKPRSERTDEWTLVGLLGQVFVRCDKTVKPGDYVKSDNKSIGTKADEKTKMRAMKVTKAFNAKQGYAIVYCLLN
jgi:hypothetical protein